MRILPLLFAFSVPLALSCGDEPTECPAIAEWSVTVHVHDADGKPVPGASVTYTVDGGPETPADCLGTNPDACDRWVAGTTAGAFEITAQNADGTKTAHASVQVGSGECGVIGESVSLTL